MRRNDSRRESYGKRKDWRQNSGVGATPRKGRKMEEKKETEIAMEDRWGKKENNVTEAEKDSVGKSVRHCSRVAHEDRDEANDRMYLVTGENSTEWRG